MKELYLVKLGSGEYCDYLEYLAATFDTLEDAEEYIKEIKETNKNREISTLYNQWYDTVVDNTDENFDDIHEFHLKYPQYTKEEIMEATSYNRDELIILYKLILGNPAYEVHIKTECLN